MPVDVSRATSSSERSRGLNRGPVGMRGDIRSTRKVRQSSRSMSQATRYQRRPVNRNQYRPDVCAIAAPILDADGTPLATIAISMPASRYDPARLPELGRLVTDTAAEVTARRLGA